jgi:hypothetical protein
MAQQAASLELPSVSHGESWMKRTRYQFGSVDLKQRKRGVAVWVYRYFEEGKRKSVIVGTIEQYPSKAAALKASEGFRLIANPDNTNTHLIHFGGLIDRYVAGESYVLRSYT